MTTLSDLWSSPRTKAKTCVGVKSAARNPSSKLLKRVSRPNEAARRHVLNSASAKADLDIKETPSPSDGSRNSVPEEQPVVDDFDDSGIVCIDSRPLQQDPAKPAP